MFPSPLFKTQKWMDDNPASGTRHSPQIKAPRFGGLFPAHG